MDCQKAAEELSLFLDQEVSPEVERGIRAHLQGCPGCRRHLQELERNRTLLAALPRVPLPEGLLARVVQELQATPPRPRIVASLARPRPRAVVGRVLALAAALLLLCLTGLTILGYYSEEPGMEVAGQPVVNRHVLDAGAPLMGEPPMWTTASYVPGQREEWP